MIITFLNKVRSDYLEEKMRLDSEHNTIRIKLEENIKFIEKLREEDESNFDVFSPRKQNVDLKNKISELEDAQQMLSAELESIKKEILEMDSKFDELDSVMKIARKQKATQLQNVDTVFEEEELVKLKVLETQENERQRIARDLHDSSVQNLVSVVHKTELCSKLIDMDPIRCKLELLSMSKTIRETIEDMRRMIFNLRPMSFDDIGFEVILERELSKIKEKGIYVDYSVEGEPYPLLPVVALTLFRIIAEACNNSLKHADAQVISVKIFYKVNGIQIIISDNGKGFDIANYKNYIKEDYSGFGLSTMRERISLLSGKIDMKSEEGKGTKISIEIPIEHEEE